MERPDVHHASPDTAADLIEDASAYQVGDDPTRSVFSYFEEIFHALHRHLGCRVMDDVIDHRSEHFCAASLVAPVNAHSLVGRKRSTTSTLFTIARTYTNAGVVSLDAPPLCLHIVFRGMFRLWPCRNDPSNELHGDSRAASGHDLRFDFEFKESRS
jgi:hypothetical protein